MPSHNRSPDKIAVLAFILAGFASISNVYAAPKDELEKTNREIEKSKAKQAELLEQSRQTESELKALQEKLVKLAQSIQKGEAELSEVETQLRQMNEQLRIKNDQLKERQQHLSGLVQAALRLSRMPKEAMLMMPGDRQETIKAARVLKITSDSIYREIEEIGVAMVELDALKQKIAQSYETLSRKQAALDKEQQTLKNKLAERKQLLGRLGFRQQREAERLSQLSKKATDLQDLVSSLQKQEKDNASFFSSKPDDRTPPGKKGKLRSFMGAKGRILSPVAGQLIQNFGIPQGRNATSKGIVISARSQAQVIAPYDGEVVFTGPFLGYGQLVILRHSDEFHTLLAGFAKIDAEVGQFLLEGEPIGAMGEDGQGNRPGNRLYVELRKNNQPVDPVPWINRLQKKN